MKSVLHQHGAFSLNNYSGLALQILELLVLCLEVWAVTHFSIYSPWYWVGQFLLGISILRNFFLLHECGHGSMYRSPSLNTLGGFLCSMLCPIPFVYWRNCHRLHHLWTGVIDKDPLAGNLVKLKYGSKIKKKVFQFIWRYGIPIPSLTVIASLWLYPLWEAKRKKTAQDYVLEYVSLATSFLAWAIWIAWLGWNVVPCLLVFLLGFDIINLAHHAGLFPYESSTRQKPVPLHEQDVLSRSTPMRSFFSIFFAYNFNLHSEHHLFPTAPWFRLNAIRNYLLDQKIPSYQSVDLLKFTFEARRQDGLSILLKGSASVPAYEQSPSTKDQAVGEVGKASGDS